MAGKKGKTLTETYRKNLAAGEPKATDRTATKTVFSRKLKDQQSDAKLKSNARANQRARKQRLMDEVKGGKPITKNRSSVYTTPKKRVRG